jgi:hypothetical protein
MLQLLADENFHGDVVRGLVLREPDLNIVTVQDVALSGADDPTVLAWAAEQNRIVLTHDRTTMTKYAYERVARRETMPGVFVVEDRYPVGRAIQAILIAASCSEMREWIDRVAFFPM